GARLDSPLLQARAADSYRQLRDGGFNADDRRADFFFLSRLVLRCPASLTAASVREVGSEDVYFPDYEALVARGADDHGRYWEFAAKAGSNHEHHNHNDCGTFILHVDGAPAVMEIGAPEYVRDYFNEQRYTFLAARSAGHSVPRVNGFEQAAGEPFDAQVIRTQLTADRVEFAMDLAKSYPAEARCRRLIRTFIFDRRAGRLIVRDEAEFEGEGTLESAVVADGRVDCGATGAWIATEAGRLRLTPSNGTVLTGLDHPEYRNRQEQPATVNRLLLSGGAAAASVKTEYTIEWSGRSRKQW
ncbi:MAG TPA: heparinase II/III family protein, partial [Opitutaceae bacterium]